MARARLRIWVRVPAILAVTALAFMLRLRAVDLLPIDYDEDDYLHAAQHYAQALAAGDWDEIVDYDYNYEHPPLTKLVYGAAILPLEQVDEIPLRPTSAPPAATLPEPHFRVARLTAATIGTLQVFAVAILNPLAGLFLAIYTWQIKYTSQIMLEPLPSLVSTLAVLFYVRARGKRKPNAWFFLSAACIGLTAASKYPYCIAGIVIAADWLWHTRPRERSILRQPAAVIRWLGPVVAWGTVAIAVLFAADPRLWSDPLSRLKESVSYHGGYAQSEHVRRAGLPVWQPLVWLSQSVPWHPGVFVVSADLLIGILALAGLGRLRKRRPVLLSWLLVTLGFLLVWTTKWPQYILMLTAPLALAAAEGFGATVWEPLVGWLSRLRSGAPLRASRPAEATSPQQLRRALPWLLPGLVVLGIISLFPLVYQGAMALTDFGLSSIRDGINGGVWREVWRGLTGQVEPLSMELFAAPAATAQQVRYVGPALLLQVVSGLSGGVLFFDVLWTVLSVSLQVALGVVAALLVHQRGVPFKGLWRTLFILPWAIPEFVGGVIWLRVFEPRFGWLNLASVPRDVQLPNWLGDPSYALLALLVAATWYGFPFIMLAATAGLKLVPAEVYDASAIDGAGRLEQFRRITWPLLRPLLMPAIIIRSISAFNQFYLFYAMRPPQSLATLATVSFYVFTYGNQYAVSAAINIVSVVVLLLLILWLNRRSRASEGVTYA
ncbi:MAG TPA: sugar ABC transporter permease [Anaerolineae bacterium]|nr:sugar ABC transporter permease [Anaerolineae bacterium]